MPAGPSAAMTESPRALPILRSQVRMMLPRSYPETRVGRGSKSDQHLGGQVDPQPSQPVFFLGFTKSSIR